MTTFRFLSVVPCFPGDGQALDRRITGLQIVRRRGTVEEEPWKVTKWMCNVQSPQGQGTHTEVLVRAFRVSDHSYQCDETRPSC